MNDELSYAKRLQRDEADFGGEDDAGEVPQGGNPQKGWASTTPMNTDGSLNGGVALAIAFPKAGMYTLQFAIQNYVFNPLGNFSSPNCQALITWTVRGISMRRLVSVTDGVSIQGNAEAVSVQLTDVSQDTAGNGSAYTVAMTVVEGMRANSLPVRLANDVQMRQIPGLGMAGPFAVPKSVGVTAIYVEVASNVGAAIPENQILLTQRSSGPPIVGQGQCDPRVFQWIPISPGTDSVVISNGAAGAVNYRLFWAIDG